MWNKIKPILTWLTNVLLLGRNAGLWSTKNTLPNDSNMYNLKK